MSIKRWMDKAAVEHIHNGILLTIKRNAFDSVLIYIHTHNGTLLSHTDMSCRRKWRPTPAFLPGEFPQRTLAGSSPWGHKEADTSEWASDWQVPTAILKTNTTVLINYTLLENKNFFKLRKMRGEGGGFVLNWETKDKTKHFMWELAPTLQRKNIYKVYLETIRVIWIGITYVI